MSQPKQDTVLVIVPAFNEEANIAGVIAELKSCNVDLDILVINDGSTDNTSAVAAGTGQALVLDLPKNLGIGGAVRTGFKFASRQGYQTAIQFDGDGQHIAAEIHKLLTPLKEYRAHMVIGSRFLGNHDGFRSTFIRRIGIKVFQIVNSLLIGQLITDNTSGFRAYDRKAIEFLARWYPVDYPEPEAVILLGRNGLMITEKPVLMRERRDGSSSIAGVISVYYMLKVLLAVLMTALRKPVIHGRDC
nr:glycosyltransferase family 2 protein [Geotalea sp. SG265]